MTSRVFCSLQARAPTSSRRTSHSAQIRGVLPPRPARSAQAASADDRHHRLVGHAGPAGAFILMCFVWAIRLTYRVFCVQVTHVSDGVHSTTTKAFATACIVLFAALVSLFTTLILVWAIKWIDGVFCLTLTGALSGREEFNQPTALEHVLGAAAHHRAAGEHLKETRGAAHTSTAAAGEEPREGVEAGTRRASEEAPRQGRKLAKEK